MFLAAFLLLQGALLPWVISNDIFPLWMDIAMLAIILMGCVFVIEIMAKRISFCLKDEVSDKEE